MPPFVPYLQESQIEQDAQRLLDEFAHARGITICPPVPVEDIVEKHLKLTFEFDDMHRRLGIPRRIDTGSGPDILGAIFFEDRLIAIDESLCPDDHPSMEGRFRFTLAHEGGGHWRLHRNLFLSSPPNGDLFGAAPRASFVCRSGDGKRREEWQADYYASCVLMPRSLVFAEWKALVGDHEPRMLEGAAEGSNAYDVIGRACLTTNGCSMWLETEEEALERFCRPLAQTFRVSAIAMRIRLERLGLVLRDLPRQRQFATG